MHILYCVYYSGGNWSCRYFNGGDEGYCRCYNGNKVTKITVDDTMRISKIIVNVTIL